MFLLVGLFLFGALVVIALALPLMQRRVPPNGLYGLRVSATLSDEWVWYEANAASGRDLLKLGFAQLVAATLPLAFLPARTGSDAGDRRGFDGLRLVRLVERSRCAGAIADLSKSNRPTNSRASDTMTRFLFALLLLAAARLSAHAAVAYWSVHRVKLGRFLTC
jgi:hypothetical protein